jgi:hypothetical protein
MLCTKCGREIKRVCRDCQAKQAHRGMLLHQRRFLQTWMVGGLPLRVRAKGDVVHLELFDDRWHGYCGESMFALTERRLVRQLPPDMCPECVKVFHELVAAAKPA